MSLSLKDLDLAPYKNVLVRCDLDVSVSSGVVDDDFRLRACLETLNYLLDRGKKVYILGHRGRPEGAVVDSLSTLSLQSYFESNLNSPNFVLLDNVRFDPREKSNDITLVEDYVNKYQLDLYINESFATSHREHSSIVGFPKLLDSCIGLTFEKELRNFKFNSMIKNSVAIIGGIKVETKLPTIHSLAQKFEHVLLGGTLGMQIETEIPHVSKPSDYNDSKDLGPITLENYINVIKEADFIFYAGPVGMFEVMEFAQGTKDILRAIELNTSAKRIAGGGDTLKSIKMFSEGSYFDFLSTGGGSLLTLISTGSLVGLEAIKVGKDS
jgi:phosphoglycerate kinase